MLENLTLFFVSGLIPPSLLGSTGSNYSSYYYYYYETRYKEAIKNVLHIKKKKRD